MSWRTIYLLVTDLSKEPSDVVMDDDCYEDSFGRKQWTVSEFANFWLNTIHERSAMNGKHSPVILVGTFADKIKDKDDPSVRLEKLEKSLRKNVTGRHVIDNTSETGGFDELKKTIVEEAKKQNYWGELIPAKWIQLEEKLHKRKEREQILEKKILLETMMKENGPITTLKELDLFLKFHHETGNLIHFSEDEALNTTIVLNPQWLINAFKSLNPQREFYTDKHEQFKEWIDFDKYGILLNSLIEQMWKEDPQVKSVTDGNKDRNTSEFFEHKEHILNYLEKLQLLAKPHKDTFNISNVNEFYFAPSFVKQKVQDKDLLPVGNKITTSKLCFVAKSGYIPSAVFNKLLATSIAAYPLKCVDIKTYLLFCGCGIFNLNDEHELFLLFNENAIQIWMSREGKTPESSICIKVKEFFESKIPEKDFKLLFKIPQTSYIRMDGGFKFKRSDVGKTKHDFTTQVTVIPEQLTKIWFPDDKITTGNPDDNNSVCLKRPDGNCNYNGRLVQLKPDEMNKIARNCGGNTVFGALRKIQVLKSEGFALEVSIRRIHVVDENKEYVRQKIYASRFRHPFIVPTYAIFEKEHVFYFVSPYCENRDLKSRLSQTCCNQDCCDNAAPIATAASMPRQSCNHSTKKNCGCKLNVAQRIRIAFQVASAIHYLHTPRINYLNRASTKTVTVHGDISSKNIVLDRNLNARLIDFKNSYDTDVEMTATSTEQTQCGSDGQNVNQPNTQIANRGNKDIKTDYKSFDEVIAELMEGITPAGEGEEMETIRKEMETIRKDIKNASTVDEFKTNVVDKLKIKLQELGVGAELMARPKQENDERQCDVCMINQSDEEYCKDHTEQCIQEMAICSACNYNSHLTSQTCYSCGASVKPFLGENEEWGAILIAGKGTESDTETFQRDVECIDKVIKHGSIKISEKNVHTIKSDVDDVLSTLDVIGKTFTDKCSTVLIYFSCHGRKDHSFKVGSCYITLESLTKVLEDMTQVKTFVIVLDRCYCPYIELKTKRVIQISSCSPSEQSVYSIIEQSIFTKYFAQALKGESCITTCKICRESRLKANDYISVADLFEYIKAHVLMEEKQQNPGLMFRGSELKIAYIVSSHSECTIQDLLIELDKIKPNIQ